MILDEHYVGYSYAYPHKTAYRPLAPRALDEVWRGERRDALFLYIHVPFCAVRCGFCNLFATTDAAAGRYLEALRRDARAVDASLGERRFARLAIGGGTPTYLSARELESVFDLAEELGAAGRPTSVEASPDTVGEDHFTLLRERGVGRFSLGVQSFDEEVCKALGRPQRRADVMRALEGARRAGFNTLNIDLIYGGQQSLDAWLSSLREALQFAPEELYLYPLYVRPLTGLGKRARLAGDTRPAAYRAARELLLSSGYRQVSMRMFRRASATEEVGPVYCCQEDGMIGLGPGARSYTRALHYSTEYAVGRGGIGEILDSYYRREAFGQVVYGFELDGDEQRRRWVMQSLLQCEGLSRTDYRRRFDAEVLEDLPQLGELLARGLATVDEDRLRLTDEGVERSDAIGPWLASAAVRARMERYSWR